MTHKLELALVPSVLWGRSLAHHLANWGEVKAKVCECGQCALCDTKTDKLDAHEVWEYHDDTHIVDLADIIPVCDNCHSVLHYGYSQIHGKEQQAFAWYCKVNNLTPQQANTAIRMTYIEWEMRSVYKDWRFSGNLATRVEQVTGVNCSNYSNAKVCYLKVPFEEKEEAKALGARWDSERKMWFISKEVLDTPGAWDKFAKWGIPDDDISAKLNGEQAKDYGYYDPYWVAGRA